VAKEGSKKVPIAGIDDKHQITLVLAAAMTGKLHHSLFIKGKLQHVCQL